MKAGLWKINSQSITLSGESTDQKMIEKPVSPMRTIINYALRLSAIIFVPIATQFPAAICLYWFSSGIFSLIQNLIFRTQWFSKWSGFDQVKRIMEEKAKKKRKLKDIKM